MSQLYENLKIISASMSVKDKGDACSGNAEISPVRALSGGREVDYDGESRV